MEKSYQWKNIQLASGKSKSNLVLFDYYAKNNLFEKPLPFTTPVKDIVRHCLSLKILMVKTFQKNFMLP